MKLIIHSKSLMKVIVTFMMIRHCTAIMRRGVSSVTIRNIKSNKNWMKSAGGMSSADDSMGGRSSDRPVMAASSLNYETSTTWSGNGITRGFSSNGRINTSSTVSTSSGSSSSGGRTALHAKQGGSTTTAAAPVDTASSALSTTTTATATATDGGRVVVKSQYKTLTSTFLCGAPAVVITYPLTHPLIQHPLTHLHTYNIHPLIQHPPTNTTSTHSLTHTLLANVTLSAYPFIIHPLYLTNPLFSPSYICPP